MDDVAFKQWSAKLTDLRRNRQILFDQRAQDLSNPMGPTEFFDMAEKSLDEVMDSWFGFTQQSWVAYPAEDPNAEVENIQIEMNSTLDFELDAIERDQASVQSHINWDLDAMNKTAAAFQSAQQQLRDKYLIKVKSLVTGTKKRVETLAQKTPQANVSGRGSGGGSGLGMFMMFLLGLLLGGAGSVYYWDASNKIEKKFQEDRSKILDEQRALADGMTVLHDNFDQLAMAKIKNIPELDKEINRITAFIDGKRKVIESNYEKSKERLMKKIPAGDRLDNAIAEIASERDVELATLKKQEASSLDPLIKQRTVIKDLISH